MAAKRHAGEPAATSLEEAARRARRIVVLAANILRFRFEAFSELDDAERSG